MGQVYKHRSDIRWVIGSGMDLNGTKLSEKEIERHTQNEILRNRKAHAHKTPYSFYRKVYKQKMHNEQKRMVWAGGEE